MKKILLMNFIMAALISVASASNEQIPRSVINEFQKQFGVQPGLRWETMNEPGSYQNLYVGHFIQNGIWSEAYFDESGEYLGVGKSITESQLPATLKLPEQDKYTGFSVIEVYEYASKNSTNPVYGLTIAHKDRMIFLKINESGILSEVKKQKYKN